VGAIWHSPRQVGTEAARESDSLPWFLATHALIRIMHGPTDDTCWLVFLWSPVLSTWKMQSSLIYSHAFCARHWRRVTTQNFPCVVTKPGMLDSDFQSQLAWLSGKRKQKLYYVLCSFSSDIRLKFQWSSTSKQKQINSPKLADALNVQHIIWISL
jgi:hypothetical protein